MISYNFSRFLCHTITPNSKIAFFVINHPIIYWKEKDFVIIGKVKFYRTLNFCLFPQYILKTGGRACEVFAFPTGKNDQTFKQFT